jgi:hypothetical protein
MCLEPCRSSASSFMTVMVAVVAVRRVRVRKSSVIFLKNIVRVKKEENTKITYQESFHPLPFVLSHF